MSLRELELPAAVAALSALAHPHRLGLFRLLVRTGAEGLAAGVIAEAIGVPPSTLSTQLNILSQAGLVGARREGRSIIYAADYEGMRDLLAFLVADCCDGRPEICAPLGQMAEIVACCGPE